MLTKSLRAVLWCAIAIGALGAFSATASAAVMTPERALPRPLPAWSGNEAQPWTRGYIVAPTDKITVWHYNSALASKWEQVEIAVGRVMWMYKDTQWGYKTEGPEALRGYYWMSRSQVGELPCTAARVEGSSFSTVAASTMLYTRPAAWATSDLGNRTLAFGTKVTSYCGNVIPDAQQSFTADATTAKGTFVWVSTVISGGPGRGPATISGFVRVNKLGPLMPDAPA